MVIRSYVRVFRLQRRIYNFGDWRIPAPNGIPLLGFVYYVAALLVFLVLSHLPLIGIGWVAWPWRYLILPVWIAAAGMRFSPDGRRADLFLVTWLCLTGRRVMAMLRERLAARNKVSKLRVKWDASGTELHRAQIKGPATVAFAVPVELNDRWHGWAAEGGSGECREVPVRADQTLRVCP